MQDTGSPLRRAGGPFRRASIRTRVALFATLLALGCLGTVGYIHLSALSNSLSVAAHEQSATLSTQLARATAGSGDEVIAAIPYTSRGLDGLVMVDPKGNIQGSGGKLAKALKPLRVEAMAVSRSAQPVVQFRDPQGSGVGPAFEKLGLTSPQDSIQVTIVPRDGGGALVTGYHVDWALDQIRSSALSSLLALGGGALFMCFGLMLMLGRLVTRPIGRLAGEVRHLGEGNLVASLSPQRTPELRQLTAGISQMRDDLLHAEKQSSTDPLTGIANHRAFHERLGPAVEEAQRTATPLALIALDLDNLKAINDRCGHVAGDRLIEAVARQIAGACREGDLCARVGGDEFAVICPGADRRVAAAIGERIASAVRGLSMTELVGREAAGVGLGVAISVGVSDMPEGARSKDELILRADAAMYDAKGRRPAARVQEPRVVDAAPDADRLLHTVRALALAVDAKDSGTRSHGDTVADYATEIGRELGIDGADLEALRRAALLHDVGKIGTPDAILQKPGPLTPEERREMSRHSALGYRILRGGGLPEREAIWVLHHHEHLDGSGYPHGLKGDEIPLEARILLVSEAFEAMTSERPYRAPRSVTEALAELRRCAGTQFDPRAVEALATVLKRGTASLNVVAA